MKKIILILPALNEASVIGQTLQGVKRVAKNLPGKSEIVVVNDGSKDKTAAVAKKFGATVLSHKINRGLGASLSTGLKYARMQQADFAVTLDSDGQHDPEDIKKIIRPLIAGEADIVIGSRLLEPQGRMPLLRQINNRLFNLFTLLIFGMYTTDSLSGFRGFSKPAIDKLELKTERMEVSNEFFSEIKRNKFRFTEVPIQVIYTPYSIRKGVRPGNVFAIIFRLLLRLFR
ncbi:MAG: Glycosyl transferase family 2 [Candidatus Beckwithbacteria bacterium GW2011_GWB1_47_15]|uniref:Glycosyl transferase family 2 n=1 Tax=Candidatus Beckwithbacteria bacterium GW2011_GWB1_47_15 TaxID=1618371 RepID=A0A0G1RUY9_9BACT|nr:MAG: glycosyl transferase family 2 [Candidatus Beckwithbacteria bacterium GW2011_GWC1_49_16]KKU35718.1 MAG: Glycosyl transferase family 2 [Candidatus Beckwithbacteria bacterium GW2011_GWA1_46_30]KKU60972.1 MAG: Glycosyl transferase family 2 [Candidatus Beckwithbacteria bacterium GW2011_GWB1_47_15]KKU72277.1 MAG: Glycosyl transferase family 2 [Candidatus Beckwithbacteria bacterium GW2011_GWA2_47_25]KKW04963.1 MAG: Glycosyl transferase family 2 [Candidatus Beckwithbacteria bacterium GW2011_GWC